MTDRLPRVLLLAEKANPNWISVPLVGWKHVELIAQFAAVHLVTHERNRDNILASGFSPRDVSFVGETRLERTANALASALEGEGAMGGATQTAFQVPMYYQFESRAFAMTREALAHGDFDLVHRVTPVSPTYASPLASWTDVPFVLGPLNGGLPWPRYFRTG